LVSYLRPNLLLLDEPTNHLDLEMRQALAVALQDYEGAVVLVSHDRHLLRSVADDLVLVDQGVARVFDGDLDDYARWFMTREQAEVDAQVEPAANSAEQRKQRKREEAELRNRLSPLKNEIAKLEKRLAQAQEERGKIELSLADSELYAAAAKVKLQDLLQKQTDNSRLIDTLEEQWLEAHDRLEQAMAQAGVNSSL